MPAADVESRSSGSGYFLSDAELGRLLRRAGPALARLVLHLELRITDVSLRTLLHFGCTNIRHLEIAVNGNIQADVLEQVISQTGSQLRSVVLRTASIRNETVRQLLLSAPNLIHLNLGFNWNLTLDAFPPLVYSGSEQYEPRGDGAARRGHGDDPVWSPAVLGTIGHLRNPRGTTMLPKLETLDLSRCTGLGDAVVPRIIYAFGASLRVLNLDFTKVTAHCLADIFRTARGCGFKSVAPPHSTRSPSARQGALALCELGLSLTALSTNTSLVSLGTVMARDPRQRPWQVAEFAAMVPNLTSLHIADGRGILSDALVAQIAHCFRALVSIDIHNSSQLTDAALLSLAEHCPALEAADISMCNLFTADGIGALVESCTQLRVLNLKALRITDTCLELIGNTLRQLEVLNLWGCPLVTATGIKAALLGADGLGCRCTLQKLVFSGASCDKDEAEIADFCRQNLQSGAQVTARSQCTLITP